MNCLISSSLSTSLLGWNQDTTCEEERDKDICRAAYDEEMRCKAVDDVAEGQNAKMKDD